MTRHLFALGLMISVAGCQPVANLCFALETPPAPQAEPKAYYSSPDRKLMVVGCGAPTDLDRLLNRR